MVDGDPLADLSLLGDATLMTVWKDGAEVARGGALTTVWPQEMAA